MPRRYLNGSDAAEYLGISEPSLRRLASNRDIDYIPGKGKRGNRYDVQDLDTYMAAHKVKAGER